MNYLRVIFIFFISLSVFSQNKLETTVLTIDLSSPKKSSVSNSNGKKRLVVDNKNPVAVKLINGNPFKYKYVLSYSKIDLFGTQGFSIEPSVGEDVPTGDTDDDGIVDPIDTGGPEINNLTSEELILSIDQKLKDANGRLDAFLSEVTNSESIDNEELKETKAFLKKSIEDINEKILILESNFDSIEIKESIVSYKSRLSQLKEELQRLSSVSTENYLLPIDIFGDNIDYVLIKIEVYNNKSSIPKIYKYKIWLKGGLKIDVSGGAFITSLFDEEFSTTTLDNNNKTISKNNNGDYDFGFGALVNISLRGGSWVRPTLNFGTLLTSNQKFQIMTGGGLILGKNQRFVISAGITMGRINVLSNSFIADGTTEYDLGSSGDVPTNEKFEIGNFIGITYNFTNSKK